jgi:hypothetical protein
MNLPTFIYQLIDHIYVSDGRAFAFYDKFDLVVRTDSIFMSSPLSITMKGKTKLITSTKGSMDKSDEVIVILKEYTLASKKILLFSDHWESTCTLFLHYVSHTYQFSTMDMYHMMNSSRFPSFLSTQMNSIIATLSP